MYNYTYISLFVFKSIWRNFRSQYAAYLSSANPCCRSSLAPDGTNSSPSPPSPVVSSSPGPPRASVPESVATMYPVVVPTPSNIGEYTYARFLSETPLIKNAKRRQAIIRQVEQDIEGFRRLKLRTELRDPPLTKSGRCLTVRGRRVKSL